ncbi:glycosyltransferase [Algirhabdus cladophorae]|uniref:glycosyltransferase n=1 Tax=Algirhabdus cladophorae TaxID=3377108 RepID=UPI003B84986B
MNTLPPRVFIGTEEIAGYYSGLAQGFREIGVPVTKFLSQEHSFKYEKSSVAEQVLRKIGRKYREASKTDQKKHILVSRIPRLERWITKQIIRRHDLFIFGFMTSLDGMMVGGPRLTDLKRIKRAGKKIICVFHGSEVRPRWLNGKFIDYSTDDLLARAKKQIQWLRVIEEYADAIVSHPPMAPFQTRSSAHYLAIGVPLPAAKLIDTKTASKTDRIRILHAPSNPETKGSALIQGCIDELVAAGHKIDFKLLTGVPHTQVCHELAQSDLVIDQVFSDTPMAHFAAEAASYGCPSIICGNDLTRLRDVTDPDIWPPSILGRPEELKSKIEWAITHPDERIKIGKSAQEFVKKNWTAAKVAQNLLRLAENDIPESWMFDPNSQLFLGGYGMTIEQRDRLVSRMISDAGSDFLDVVREKPGFDLPIPQTAP